MYDVYDIKQAARLALQIQDASNLSGVLHAWANVQAAVREDCNKEGIQQEEHPVNILFLSKVTSLMEVEVSFIGSITSIDREDLFGPAYLWAKEKPSE